MNESVAADLVPPYRRVNAIAIRFAGLTTANVLGVPLGTLLGQQLGWRATFWAIMLAASARRSGRTAPRPVERVVPAPDSAAVPSIQHPVGGN